MRAIILHLLLLSCLYMAFCSTSGVGDIIISPNDEQMDIPNDHTFIIKIDIMDDQNNTIPIDDTHPLFEEIKCRADTHYEKYYRCIDYADQELEKIVDAFGSIYCLYENLPANKRTTIRVKYGSNVLKTYNIGYPEDEWDINSSQGSFTNKPTVGTHIHIYYFPKNGNGNHLNKTQVLDVKSLLNIESNIPSIVFKNTPYANYVLARGRLDNVVQEYYFRLYRYVDDEKEYVYNVTFTSVPDVWDAKKSDFFVDSHIYTSRYNGNHNNTIQFIQARDKYNNDIHEIEEEANIKFIDYSSHVPFYSNFIPVNEYNEVIISSDEIHAPNHIFIGSPIIVSVRAPSTEYEFQVMRYIY